MQHAETLFLKAMVDPALSAGSRSVEALAIIEVLAGCSGHFVLPVSMRVNCQNYSLVSSSDLRRLPRNHHLLFLLYL